MKTIQQLSEEKRKLSADIAAIIARAKESKESPPDDEKLKLDNMLNDLKKLNEDVDRAKAIEQFEMNQGLQDNGKGENKTDNKKVLEEDFAKYMRTGRLTETMKAQVTAGYGSSPTLGGYTVPEGFQAELEKTMKFYGGMLEASRLFRTDSGNEIPWPATDDTANEGVWLDDEHTPTNISVVNVTMSEFRLYAWNIHSGEIRVSLNLMEDSAFDIVSEVNMLAAERLGRGINKALTTGDGSKKPRGLVPQLTANSRNVNAADDATLGRDDLITVMFNVDRSYRTGPNVGYMFNDSTLAALLKLDHGSSDSRPLWQPSMRDGEPDRINGQRYWINNHMANIGAGNIPVVYGDFNKYIYRVVGSAGVRRLDEKYIDKLQMGYLVFMRVDGGLLQKNAFSGLRNPTT